MIKGPEFYIRFVNYAFGDKFLVMAPTVGLIAVILAFMLLVYVATALYYRSGRRKEADILMKDANQDRERAFVQLEEQNKELKKQVKHWQREASKWKQAAGSAQILIRRAAEVIQNPARIKLVDEKDGKAERLRKIG